MKRLLKVLNIINKYAPDAYISADHDVIYIGKANPEIEFTRDESKTLEELGCDWDADLDAWRIFV